MDSGEIYGINTARRMAMETTQGKGMIAQSRFEDSSIESASDSSLQVNFCGFILKPNNCLQLTTIASYCQLLLDYLDLRMAQKLQLLQVESASPPSRGQRDRGPTMDHHTGQQVGEPSGVMINFGFYGVHDLGL